MLPGVREGSQQDIINGQGGGGGVAICQYASFSSSVPSSWTSAFYGGKKVISRTYKQMAGATDGPPKMCFHPSVEAQGFKVTLVYSETTYLPGSSLRVGLSDAGMKFEKEMEERYWDLAH